MKYPKLIVTSGAALLFAVSVPIAWGQTRPVTGSAIEVGAAAVQDSASAMDQQVSRKITQAWSEGKDASGAAAFQENGEIALGEGKQQQARPLRILAPSKRRPSAAGPLLFRTRLRPPMRARP
jgi:hypothetical protein